MSALRLISSHLGLLAPLFLIALFSLTPEASFDLRYQRSEILIGEWWRIYSGQLGHLSLNHLLLNLGGLILFWLLFSRTTSSTIWLLVIALSMTTTGLGLLWLSPELKWYLGFSGVLHALFFCGLIFELRLKRQSTTIPLLLLLLAKLVWELFIGAIPGSAELIGGNVVVEAHLYGAFSGILIGILLPARLLRPKSKRSNQNDIHPIERYFS